MSVEVVTVTNAAPTAPYYAFEQFKESLRRFGVEPTILGWGEPWFGLMTKPYRLREWLNSAATKPDYLIVCDSWDVVFADIPEAIVEQFMSKDYGELLFNAERNCFPLVALAERFPDPGTPYRFLNSGVIIGPVFAFHELLDRVFHHAGEDIRDRRNPDGSWYNPNDQEFITLAYLDQPVPMALDTRCEIAQTLHAEVATDFDFDGPKIRNKITGTCPMVFHCNGGAKDSGIKDPIFQKLGLKL